MKSNNKPIGIAVVEYISHGEVEYSPKLYISKFVKLLITWHSSFVLLTVMFVIINFVRIGDNYNIILSSLNDLNLLNMSCSFLLSIFLELMINGEDRTMNKLMSGVMIVSFILMMISIMLYLSLSIIGVYDLSNKLYESLPIINGVWLFCSFVLACISAYAKALY